MFPSIIFWYAILCRYSNWHCLQQYTLWLLLYLVNISLQFLQIAFSLGIKITPLLNDSSKLVALLTGIDTPKRFAAFLIALPLTPDSSPIVL